MKTCPHKLKTLGLEQKIPPYPKAKDRRERRKVTKTIGALDEWWDQTHAESPHEAAISDRALGTLAN